jgi:hypothetical protein
MRCTGFLKDIIVLSLMIPFVNLGHGRELPPRLFSICTLRATRVPGGETSELGESAGYLESVNEQLSELRTRCQAESSTFSAVHIDLKENEWRFFLSSARE